MLLKNNYAYRTVKWKHQPATLPSAFSCINPLRKPQFSFWAYADLALLKFLATPHGLWGLGSPHQESDLGLLQWKHGVLTTGLPEEFPLALFLKKKFCFAWLYFSFFVIKKTSNKQNDAVNTCAHHLDSTLNILSYYVYIFANHFKVSYWHHCHSTFEYFSTSPKKKKGIFHITINHYCTKKFSNVSWCAVIPSPYFSIPSCPKVWSQLHFHGSCELWSLHQSDGASVTEVSLLRHIPHVLLLTLSGAAFWVGRGGGWTLSSGHLGIRYTK